MKENNIDKLFKAKASEGRFPYSESHWADAEKLLDEKLPVASGGFTSGALAGAAFVLVGALAVLAYFIWPSNKTNSPLVPMHEIVVSPEKTIHKKAPSTKDVNSTTHTIETKNEIENTTVFTQKANKSSNNPPLAGDAQLSNEQLIAQSPAPTTGKEAEKNKASSTKNLSPETIAAAPLELESTPNNLSGNSENSAPESMIESEATAVATPPLNNETPKQKTVLVSEAGIAQNENAVNNEDPSSKANAEKVANTHTETENNSIVAAASADEETTSAEESPEEINPDYGIKKPFSKLDNFNVSLGASFTMLLANRTLSMPNTAHQDFRNANENARNINSYGLEVQLGYKNWIFNTGVFKTQYEENINYPTSLITQLPVDNGQWNAFDVWTYQVDSTWQVDSIYLGSWQTDTIWSVYTDSTYAPKWDTVLGEKESPELARNNGVRTMSYVEVPLWFGRSFGQNKFTIDVQAGFAIGFLTTVKGSYYINPQNNALEDLRIEQHQQIMYNAMLRTGIRYAISPKINVGAFPTLRYNLNSTLKGEGINQRYFGYGLTLGLYYQF